MMRAVGIVCPLVCICIAAPVLGDEKPVVVELWPDKIPDERPGIIGPEKIVMSPKLDRK